MVFSSLLFLFRFLPAALLAYFAAPRRYRNGILFISSLIFYGWGEPVYILLLLFSTVVDFTHGKLVDRLKRAGNVGGAKLAVASSVLINLGLLGLFKYTDFLIGAFNHISGGAAPLLNLALPIGISFYTFQTMSYTIDVYRGKAGVQTSIVAFGAYVSMFPQLIAGPIVRYSTIAKELTDRRETLSCFSEGVVLFVSGLGKKVLFANQLGQIWDEIIHIIPEQRSILMVWLGIFAFGMQIYFDFSGYSDMALGLGRMFGFHFPENFHYPYESKSVTEFWRRWHISLGTWFKEYVYFPLGGSRCGRFRQLRNILIVWLLTGIWHGAGWNFLLWGLYFAFFLLLEKFLLKDLLDRCPSFIRWFYAMMAVFMGWVLFAFDDMQAGILYFRQLFGMAGLETINERTLYILITNLILMAAAAIGATSLPKAFCREHIQRKSLSILEPVFVVAVLLVSVAFLVNAGYNPFLYFRF